MEKRELFMEAVQRFKSRIWKTEEKQEDATFECFVDHLPGRVDFSSEAMQDSSLANLMLQADVHVESVHRSFDRDTLFASLRLRPGTLPAPLFDMTLFVGEKKQQQSLTIPVPQQNHTPNPVSTPGPTVSTPLTSAGQVTPKAMIHIRLRPPSATHTAVSSPAASAPSPKPRVQCTQISLISSSPN